MSKIAVLHFYDPFSLIRLYLKLKVFFFFFGIDRKLKFGMADPYYMFLKLWHSYVDICFGF